MSDKTNGYHLSPSETRLLALIPHGGKKTTTDVLMKRFYRNVDEVPYHGRISISGLVRSLVKKTKGRRPRVVHGPRRGPYPIEVWIDD